MRVIANEVSCEDAEYGDVFIHLDEDEKYILCNNYFFEDGTMETLCGNYVNPEDGIAVRIMVVAL